MSHFAKVVNGIVEEVIVAEPERIAELEDKHLYVQTSYNTLGGVYYTPNSSPRVPDPDQSKAFRKNYAKIGSVYDVVRDAFYDQQPYPSWILDEESCLWDAPVPYPDDGQPWAWDENNKKWVLI